MTNRDEQLRLLAIFHYVVGGLAAVFSFLPVIHLALGIAMLVSPGNFSPTGQPASHLLFTWILIAIPALMIVAGLAFSACVLFAGRSLQTRTRYTFCLVMGGIECLFIPFGTVLGVFTLILLTQDEVKSLFYAKPSSTFTAHAPQS